MRTTASRYGTSTSRASSCRPSSKKRGPSTPKRKELARLVKNTKPTSRVAKWLKETKEQRAKENSKRRDENLRRIARGDDRDEKDGLLNPDPIKDVEAYIKSDDNKILPHKRFIKHCRATLVHSARIAERQTGAAQAEKHLETVERNAARYGESLAANGLKRRGSDAASDEAEQPPKKKARSPRRQEEGGRAAAAEPRRASRTRGPSALRRRRATARRRDFHEAPEAGRSRQGLRLESGRLLAVRCCVGIKFQVRALTH